MPERLEVHRERAPGAAGGEALAFVVGRQDAPLGDELLELSAADGLGVEAAAHRGGARVRADDQAAVRQLLVVDVLAGELADGGQVSCAIAHDI